MKAKRVTIYDIAREVGIAPSSVSKALNNLPSVSDKIKALVKAKANELNYKYNSNAANLRSGFSKTIGVIVPKINVAFFSNAIAGIQEVCFENNHGLIICQSDECYEKEVQCIQTLIHQNVDCILISLSQETRSTRHLLEIKNNHMELVQFDRVDESFDSHRVVNDNCHAAYQAVKHLIGQGYTKIAFLGSSNHLTVYNDRKQGYLQAIKEADLTIPYNYILDNEFKTETALKAAVELLQYKDPPDAFFTVTDHAALGVLKAAWSLGLRVPDQVG
ncbi:MAG TPA: LacI family DNA-binding transcriptional regulator, partial [Agriterribacter sp.]|nr:LacI family DNA-binding transcriptional regulator [Agriterribacter sp.]